MLREGRWGDLEAEGRGAACPAVGTGWKSFKTTPFLRASVQSISRPCQPPGCRSGHFPGQSHRHCSAWVTAAPPHAGPSFRPCQRPSILPTAAREASSRRAERALLCPPSLSPGPPSHGPGPASVGQRPGRTPRASCPPRRSRGGSWDASRGAPGVAPPAASPPAPPAPHVWPSRPRARGGAQGSIRQVPSRSLGHEWNGTCVSARARGRGPCR